MELEDLRKEWQQRDAQLTEQLRIHNQYLRSTLIDKHLAGIKRLDGMGWLYWIPFIFTVVVLGRFIADNIYEPKFFIPAVLLQIWVIAMHASQLYLRDALQKLDFGAPVVTVQKQLEAIRQKRLTRFKWGFLTGQIVWWIPLFIIAFKGLFGVDLYQVNDFMPRFMLVNVIAGVAFIPASLVVVRQISTRFQHTRLVKRIVDSLSGQDIEASQAFLSRVQEFEGQGTS
jgi:hypothetical protein